MTQNETPHLFQALAERLPLEHQAEYYKFLHEAGIGEHEVELARLLQILQLYKAYYESIPTAVQEAAARVERIKDDLGKLSAGAHLQVEAVSKLAERTVTESHNVQEQLTEIHAQVEAAVRQSAEILASQMAELLRNRIQDTVLRPVQERLTQLAASNEALDEAIARTEGATVAISKQVSLARRIHIGGYALASLLIAAALSLISWVTIHHTYTTRIEKERAALVQQIDKNREVLLKLARSQRTLELRQDPKRPRVSYLVMRDASGWESAQHHGVIEFNE